MQRNKINIGLFGFGCVGYGLYEVLASTPALNAQIVQICVKTPNKIRPIDPGNIVYDRDIILNNPDINVVVELIDDADAAYEIVTTALRNGKAVVTANKKMIAQHFAELVRLQRQYNVPLLYEAACCASIPVIRNLEEYYDNDLLDEVEGIVNGSTNYVLTQTAEKGITYQQALLEAQQKGYAESDPTSDTGGYDAKFKLVILLAHAFGIVAEPNEVVNIGIDRLGPLAFAYARNQGWKIKLVAVARKTIDGGVIALVMPKFVKPGDNLYNIDDVFNGVKIKSVFSDVQFFSGKGAGAHPTASAVISDISALSYDYRYGFKKLGGTEVLIPSNEVFLEIMLCYPSTDGYEYQQFFTEIKETYENRDGGYIIGIVQLSVIAELNALKNDISLVLFAIAPIPNNEHVYDLPREEKEILVVV